MYMQIYISYTKYNKHKIDFGFFVYGISTFIGYLMLCRTAVILLYPKLAYVTIILFHTIHSFAQLDSSNIAVTLQYQERLFRPALTPSWKRVDESNNPIKFHKGPLTTPTCQ